VYAIIQIFAIAEAKTGLDQGIRAQTGQEAGEGISKIRTRQHVIRMHTKNEVGFFLRRISQSTKNLAMFLEWHSSQNAARNGTKGTPFRRGTFQIGKAKPHSRSRAPK
jgi:hypothetical protein